MLIEGDKKIGFITSRQDFARTDAYLKDRGPSGNCRGNRHVSHHILVAASRKPCEKCGGRLIPVLRIPSQANNGVLNVFRPKIRAIRRRRVGVRVGFGSNRRWTDVVGRDYSRRVKVGKETRAA